MEFDNFKIFIEVGSHLGTDTKRFVQPDSFLFCFEPEHSLYVDLWNKYKHHDNVFILPFAVSNRNDFNLLNVSTVVSHGCNSLSKFNPNIHEDWPGRTDFTFGDGYIVPTITLRDFINLYKIPHIDYLWIDAQGHDFNVLKGLHEKISIVKEGRCEAAYNVNLYDQVENSHKSILKYLNDFNFECETELDRSGIGAECDILFKQKLI